MMRYSLFFILISLALLFSCKQVRTEEGHTEVLTEHSEEEAENKAEITGLELTTTQKGSFSVVVRAGGIIQTDSKDIVVITAKSSGIVKFADHFLFPGVKRDKGDLLFSISGEDLADENTELVLRQAESDLKRAEANYERAKKLVPDKIISEEEYLAAKNEYEKILITYNNLSRTAGATGNMVKSPESGFLRDIFVTEGQSVKSGDKLATLVVRHKLVLKTFISPDKSALIPTLKSANFKVGYSPKVFRTTDLNGRNVTAGYSTGENSFYIPVYFTLDHVPELIEGTFAEVYLVGEKKEGVITVPNSALMEEYGKFYVFEKHEDGDFVKVYVTTGESDGVKTEILSGLSENQVIVTGGTYQVKMSLAGSSVPAHSHNH